MALAAGTVSNTGATQPHSNLQPALALTAARSVVTQAWAELQPVPVRA